MRTFQVAQEIRGLFLPASSKRRLWNIPGLHPFAHSKTIFRTLSAERDAKFRTPIFDNHRIIHFLMAKLSVN